MKYQIKQRGPEISDSEIRGLERILGRPLPQDYREFLVQTNGGSCGNLEFQRESGAIESLNVFYGLRGESDSNDLIYTRILLEDRLGANRFLSIAHTPCGDVLIVDLETGGVLLWIHDAEDVEILAENFADFWNTLKVPAPEAPECDFEKWRNYSPNWRSTYGLSVVEIAARDGRVEIVKGWMEAGLSPGEAMRCAAMNGRVQVVDLLIQCGVTVNQICSDGRTPLDWARWNEEYASELRARGGKTSSELKKTGGVE